LKIQISKINPSIRLRVDGDSSTLLTVPERSRRERSRTIKYQNDNAKFEFKEKMILHFDM